MKEIKNLLNEIKLKILSLGKTLEKAEAIGVFGSLARGKNFTNRSDIDIFVIVKEKKSDTDQYWYNEIFEVLKGFGRDVTVMVYSLKSLREISNWYVLRLVSEGIIIFDKGNVKELFKEIIQTALDAGLVEEKRGNYKVWTIPFLKPGTSIEIKLK
ncbi:MAG: nucleotidyltransferase domain-containing protein [Acidobacteriota bacterium]